MAAINHKNRADHLAKLVRDERQRHGAVEGNLVGVIKGLQQQVATLNEQLAEAQTAYIGQIATTLRGNQ